MYTYTIQHRDLTWRCGAGSKQQETCRFFFSSFFLYLFVCRIKSILQFIHAIGLCMLRSYNVWFQLFCALELKCCLFTKNTRIGNFKMLWQMGLIFFLHVVSRFVLLFLFTHREWTRKQSEGSIHAYFRLLFNSICSNASVPKYNAFGPLEPYQTAQRTGYFVKYNINI
jgi:hypothetical protein